MYSNPPSTVEPVDQLLERLHGELVAKPLGLGVVGVKEREGMVSHSARALLGARRYGPSPVAYVEDLGLVLKPIEVAAKLLDDI